MAQHNSQDNVLHPHITPMSTYLKVAGGLFGLTILTVVAHQFHVQMGAWASLIAFLIAFIKATLVCNWFMHLNHDTKMNRTIFGISFFFLALLFAICFLDYATRVVEVSPL